MNPLWRLLFGSGVLPQEHRDALQGEGLVLIAEALPCTVTYRNVKTPFERSNWERSWASVAIGISGRRLLVWARGYKHIDVPHSHLRSLGIGIHLEQSDRLRITYDLGAARDDSSGEAELLIRTDQAGRIADFFRPPD